MEQDSRIRRMVGKVQNPEKVGKYLAYVLRHNPKSIGLKMDRGGWVDIEELIEKAEIPLTREVVEEVVRTDNKSRYKIEGDRIRASQGHSIDVDLDMESKKPPKYLYHGTAKRFLDAIMKEGLKKGTRQYVHLSWDEETAEKVGKRHGKPVILKVDTSKVDHDFYLSDNNVWLTDSVPANALEIVKE